MEKQSSLLEPQLRRSAEIYPPKTLWESYGGNIWEIESEAFSAKRGWTLFSERDVLSRALAQAGGRLARNNCRILLARPVRLHGCLHDPLPLPHYHPSSATLWLHQCFLCRSLPFTGVWKHDSQAESFPYASTLVRVVLSGLWCCCCWVACVAATQVGATHPPVSWDFHFPDRVTIDSLPLQRLRCIDAVASLVVELCPLQVRRFIAGTLDAANSQMYK